MEDLRRSSARNATPARGAVNTQPRRPIAPLRLLIAVITLLSVFIGHVEAFPNSVGPGICSIQDLMAQMNSTPHGMPQTVDAGYRLAVSPVLNEFGELTGKYNVFLSASSSFKGIFLVWVRNRKRSGRFALASRRPKHARGSI